MFQHLQHTTRSILIHIIRITSKSSTCDNVDCNTYNNYFDIFDLLFFVIYFTALISSLGMMSGKVMACSYISGLRDAALSTRQFVVQKSQLHKLMNWRSGKKLYLFLHSKATTQVIFTMGMKQHCSTNLFLTELIAMLVTSLLVLQNVKTG